MFPALRSPFGRHVAGIGLLFCLLGTGLTGLNLAGICIPPAPHSRTLDAKTLKLTLEFTPPERTIAILQALPAPRNGEQLREATRIMASGIIHYWPTDDIFDPETLYSPLENWAVYAMSAVEALARKAGLPLQLRFSRLERFDYRDAIRKGVGFCSQVSMALADYLDERGIASRVAGLDGHVVVEASVNGQFYILDPDYDVVIPFSVEEAAQSSPVVAKYYMERGYPVSTATHVASLYGPEGNGNYYHSPQRRLFERLFTFVKWGAPAFLFLCGAILLLLNRRHYLRRTVQTA